MHLSGSALGTPGLKKLPVRAWRCARESPRFPRARAINVATRPVAVSAMWVEWYPPKSSVRSRFAFNLFGTKRSSATDPPVAGSPRLVIPGPRSNWHRIAVGSRISVFLPGSSGFVSRVPGSAASPIPKVQPSATLVVAGEAKPAGAPGMTRNRISG
jgi:hypothetical protein